MHRDRARSAPRDVAGEVPDVERTASRRSCRAPS